MNFEILRRIIDEVMKLKAKYLNEYDIGVA